MKQQILLGIAFFCFLSFSINAQPGPSEPMRGQSGERIQAMKVAFITNKLQLTTEESQKFWPVHNEFESAKKELRESFKPEKRIRELSEKEAEEMIKATLDMEGKMLALKREYYKDLKKAIPARKIVMLKRVETEFKQKLLGEMRRRQSNSPRKRNN